MNRDPTVAMAWAKKGVKSRDHPKLFVLALTPFYVNNPPSPPHTHAHGGPGATVLGSRTDLIQHAAPPQPAAVTPLPLLDTELRAFQVGLQGFIQSTGDTFRDTYAFIWAEETVPRDRRWLCQVREPRKQEWDPAPRVNPSSKTEAQRAIRLAGMSKATAPEAEMSHLPRLHPRKHTGTAAKKQYSVL